jgi:hypothetical protein
LGASRTGFSLVRDDLQLGDLFKVSRLFKLILM